MLELEKILEEIELEKKRTSLSRDCSNEYAATEISLLEKIEKIIRKNMNDGWIPVKEYGLPKEEGVYDVTIIDGRGVYDSVRWQFLEGTHLSGHQYYVDGIHYWADNYRGNPINKFLSNRVIAWKKKPDPYRPERSNNEEEYT